MAAPDSCTTLDLSGKYIMNKSLSDPTDRILQLQGVGWFKRNAIAFSTVTLHVKHFKDAEGIEHIDIDQTIAGGFPGTSENRVLDGVERCKKDDLFGFVVSKSCRLDVADITDPYLKGEWTLDTVKDAAIHTIANSDTKNSGLTWTADQIWGFETVNDERRYTRRVKFNHKDGEEIHEVRLVYDFKHV